jgi:Fe-S-cluster-containing dehydrogenase component/formate-dependent nitrite reductase membrane component NrfD
MGETTAEAPIRWAKLIDQSLCIGCHACTTACKSENEVPLSVNRTYVKSVEVGSFPDARRDFQVTRCNQCSNAPCAVACPTGAMYRRPDGIVDFDKSICIGCKACIAACPYDAIFINPADHSAEKCNFCAHRLDVGLEPACVVVCPVEALSVGNLDDPASRVARAVKNDSVRVRRPEKHTGPNVFYKGARETTLEPLAARKPPGGLYASSTQPSGSHEIGAGNAATPSAAVLLAYDVSHKAPWDWRVGLYTTTKSVAAGAYLVAALLCAARATAWSDPLILWAAPLIALLFLALTGAVLVSDLEHPERFYLILTRPQLRSWLARGAFIITLYGFALCAHLAASAERAFAAFPYIAVPTAVLAALTSVYTGFLFAQAKGRDLWQGRALAPHLLVQAMMAGAAALLPFAAWLSPGALVPLGWILAGSAALHLLCAALEVVTVHPTEHARLALRDMYRGRFALWTWSGLALAALALGALWIGPWLACTASLLALLAYEHAYVQAGQAVPLA